MKKLLLLICSLGSLLIGAAAHAAVGFTLSPSVITNDYKGTITLNITGVGSGHQVLIRRYADLNGNGLIDAGEPLILNIPVTDGQIPMIAGVRNPNVPGDEDGSTNGNILVQLPFPTMDQIVFPAAIKSVFQVSDPLGVFATTNLSFTVLQKIQAQGITGRITSGTSNGPPLANTLVGVTSISNNLPANPFTVTDTNGNFTFYVLPDTYALQIAAVPGFVSNPAIPIPVPCGQFVTNNFAMPAAVLTLSGTVTDASSGKGIPGLAVTGVSSNAVPASNNLTVATFTDTSGN